MKRHEMWRAQYRTRRHMEHLAEDELRQRAKDVFLNQLVLTNEAKIGLPPINAEGQYWMIQGTHVLEEFVIRYGPYPAGFTNGFMKDISIPRPDVPLAEFAAKAVQSREVAQGTYIVKYGKAQYLKQAFGNGKIRIAPAASYSDPSLNPAIRDEELELTIQPPPSEFRMEIIDPNTGEKKGDIKPIGNKITTSSQTNYYIYCLSHLFTPRLFLDFDHADACLLITNPQKFIKRIVKEFEQVATGFIVMAKPVRYIDPLNTRLDDIEIFFCKHFRYAYQKEFRIVWLPHEPCQKLDYVYLTLGSLEDVCELITL